MPITTREKLVSFLNENEPRLVYFLMTLWNNQQQAITYKELREAILNGDISAEYLEDWQQDYSYFVTTYLQPMWLMAIDQAAAEIDAYLQAKGLTDILDWFDPMSDGIKEWVSTRGAEFVTNSTQTQIDALRAVVQRAAVLEDMTVDELARAIRPMVGLTKQQAVANMRYYETLLEKGYKTKTGKPVKVSQKKAREMAMKYAARQHRYRGYNIARTELAFAYNKGADDATRQAQALNLLSDTVKVWRAANDDRVCSICRELNRKVIGMDEEFDYPTKLAAMNPGIRRTPPAHPSCRCAVLYYELEDARDEGLI